LLIVKEGKLAAMLKHQAIKTYGGKGKNKGKVPVLN